MWTNTINVYKIFTSNSTKISVWSLNSQFGDTWTKATIPLDLVDPYYFIIEGNSKYWSKKY